MKRSSLLLPFLLVLFILGAIPRGFGGESAKPASPSGRITLPWDKFQKLLNLTEEEIALEVDEFALIVRQTGVQNLPDFLVKEGKVVMKRADFKTLLKSMKPPSADSALGDFLVTRASYDAKMKEESTEVKATFRIRIFPRSGREDYILVPLLRQDVALKRVLVGDKPATVGEKNGYHAIAIAKEGIHAVTADFTLTSDIKRGPQSISFPVPKTAITLLTLEIPLPSIQPEIVGANSIKRTAKGKSTIIEAVLKPTTNVNVAWSRVIPEAEKGPPKIYADLWQLLSIEDDAIRINAIVPVNVLQNTITSLTLRLPSGYQLLDVTGPAVGDWKEKEVEGKKVLNISLKTPRQGTFTVKLKAERIIDEQTTVADYNGFAIPGALREKGFLAVEMKGTAEAQVTDASGVDRAAFAELPSQLVNLSTKPLIFAYKYLRHPYNVVFDIQKHEEMPVITTVVDNASGITLFTEDGKMVHQLTYTVRNTWKQFMEVGLPKGSELWSTFVNGVAVKPIKNEKGKILIPLNRSQGAGGSLAPFEVELIYYQKGRKFWWFGWKDSSFAIPDLMMSRVMWSLYLPFNYSFIYFGGTMEKEKIARGLRPFLGIGKRMFDYSSMSQSAPAPRELQEPSGDNKAGREKTSRLGIGARMLAQRKSLRSDFGKNMQFADADMVQQVEKEMNFSQRLSEAQAAGKGLSAGTMPIRIKIPTIGQVYRFAKQIVSEEPLTVSFTYIYDTPLTIIKIIILILILYAIYRRRDWVKRNWNIASDWYRKNLAKHVTPTSLVVITAFVLVFSMFFMGILARRLFLFLFFVSLIYYVIHYLGTRRKKKPKSDKVGDGG